MFCVELVYHLHGIHYGNVCVLPLNNGNVLCQWSSSSLLLWTNCLKSKTYILLLNYCRFMMITYMNASLQLGNHIVHTVIFVCGKKIYHISDTMCVSYFYVYQNLMYLSSVNLSRVISKHCILNLFQVYF